MSDFLYWTIFGVAFTVWLSYSIVNWPTETEPDKVPAIHE